MTTVQPQFLNPIRKDALSGFAKEQADCNPGGARHLFFTTSLRMSQNIVPKAAEIYEEALVESKTIPNYVLSMVFLPITKQTIEASKEFGANALDLSPDEITFIIVLLSSTYDDASSDAKINSGVQGLRAKFEKLAAVESSASKSRHLNYAFKGTPVFHTYGPGSIAKLKAASRKYDPDGFFQ